MPSKFSEMTAALAEPTAQSEMTAAATALIETFFIEVSKMN